MTTPPPIHLVRTLPGILLLCLQAVSTQADFIHFKNGGKLEGIIREANDKQVVLSLGAGTMTIPRSKILRVERTQNAQNDHLQEEWRERHFLHPQYVPKGMESIARTARTLQSRRQQVIASRKTLADIRQQLASKQREIDLARRQHLEVSQELGRTEPRDDVRHYNQLVARNNSIVASIRLLQREHEELIEKQKAAASPTDGYMGTVADFSDQLREEAIGRGSNGPQETRDFLARVSALAEHWTGEFQDVSLQTVRSGEHTLVRARINGKRTGTFMIDTGASTLTLSSDFAVSAGIDPARLPQQQVRLANGKAISAGAVTLESLQLGDTRIENVNALVLPEAPAREVDGLLGMNVLQGFSLRMDRGTGKLHLQRFSPR